MYPCTWNVLGIEPADSSLGLGSMCLRAGMGSFIVSDQRSMYQGDEGSPQDSS